MPRHPLEIDGRRLRQMVGDVLDALIPWIEAQDSLPVSRVAGGAGRAAAVRRDLPAAGIGWRRALSTLVHQVLPSSLNTTSPGYLAYIPGGGLPHAAVADLFADLANRYVGLWMPAPAMVQLEIDVLRWFCGLVGLPAGSGGILTTGGSLANLAAVVAARRRLLPADFLRGVLYTCEQSHHSVAKAAFVAGFSERNLRVIPVDAALRIDPRALAAQVAADRAAGLQPFFVSANAGSTPAGTVDDLAALADLCAAEGLWLHVDAAYGGFFLLTERGRAALAGIDRADSVTLDPHKGLFLPYGTGALVVRRLDDLRRAHGVHANYLPPSQTESERWDFADLGPELSRDARGLRVWLPIVLHGADAFTTALDEKLDLAAAAAAALFALPHVRPVSPATLSLFSFAWEPPGSLDPDADSRRLLARINQRQRVFLTGATFFDPAVGRQVFAIRVCVLSFRTHADRIDMLVQDAADGIAALCRCQSCASSREESSR
jgi:aromatic-L-amino-acid decarboxylase